MKKRATTVAVITTTAVLVSAAVFAQSQRPTPDQAAVAFRQALMTVINGVDLPLNLMGRGRLPYDAATISKNAAELSVLTSMVGDAFQRDTTNAANIKTSALPVVWKNHDDFLMGAKQLKMQADALAAATKGGDQATIKMAIKNLGDVCGQCHMKFRQQ